MTKQGLEILGFAQVAAGVSDARFLFAVPETTPLSTRKGQHRSIFERT